MRRNIPTISKQAIADYLRRPLEEWDEIKSLSRAELDKLVAELDPVPHFHTNPRQHQLACFLLGVAHPAFLFFMSMGGGKAQPVDEPVLTPRGFVPIGSLKVGDKVVSETGKATNVIGVYPQGMKKVYEVRFSDGTSTRCCGDHLWEIFTPDGVRKVVPLKDVGKLKKGDGWWKWFIPLTKPVEFESIESLLLDPYLLGAWLGDGSSCTGETADITNTDDQLIDEISRGLPVGVGLVTYGAHRYGISTGSRGRGRVNLFTAALKHYGLFKKRSEFKFIPKPYLFASVPERIALLQGLMDTDGYVTTSGHCSYGTASRQLAEDVAFLVRSLGGTAYVSFHKNKHLGSYYVGITLPTDIQPFRLKRKMDRLVGTRRRKYPPTKSIRAINAIGEAECVCISVDSDRGLYLTKDFIATHNTKVILDLLRYRKKRGEANRALILVPNLVTIDNWQEQFETHAPDLTYTAMYGSTKDRLDKLDEDTDAFILNYQGLVYLATHNRGGRTQRKRKLAADKMENLLGRFDFLVFDESQNLGNHQSLTFQICDRLAEHAPNRYGLTGTPFGRDPMMLWPQYRVVDRGETFKTLTLFRSTFFNLKQGFWGGYEYKFKRRMEPKLRRMMRHRSIRYSSDEFTDMPERVHHKVTVSFPGDMKEYYKQFVQELIEVKKGYREHKNAFVKLRQVTSGFVGLIEEAEDEDDVDQRILVEFPDNPKLEALVDLIMSLPEDEKVIVFHDFIHSGFLISNELKRLKIDHERLWSGAKDKVGAVQRFKTDPKCRVFVANSKSASTSLNIQVARYAIFYESPVSPIVRQQAEGRIERMGQKSSRVFFYDLVVKGSVDERILKFIQEGRDLMKSLVDGEFDVRELETS